MAFSSGTNFLPILILTALSLSTIAVTSVEAVKEEVEERNDENQVSLALLSAVANANEVDTDLSINDIPSACRLLYSKRYLLCKLWTERVLFKF